MDNRLLPSWFRQPSGRALAPGLLVLLLAFPAATAADDWKFDVLRLKNGKTFQGLVVGETTNEIRFQCVRRSPGTPTVVINTTFQRDEVDAVVKLGAKDRSVLESRLKALDPTGKGEALRMDSLELDEVPWVARDGGDAFRYKSVHFVLVSNAREDIVRRAAVRLEQIYGAYARFLPPRHPAGKPTAIILVRSLAEYQAMLRGQGRNILNPAFYDAGRNQVVCASDLQRLGDDLERVRKHHKELLDQLRTKELELNRRYKGRMPARLHQDFENERRKIANANLRNDAIFQDATRQLFQTLYHEAFHAYLANFVYPPDEASVPRWLNEGLAQIFETAIIEAGELRVGHADRDRLNTVKAAARKGALVPLADLLRSGPKQFIVAHASDQQVSDSYYLNSWALAFYLTFDQRVLGTPALDDYVRGLKRGTEPLEAFRQLVGKPLAAFEKDFHQYVLKLQPDGKVAKGLQVKEP